MRGQISCDISLSDETTGFAYKLSDIHLLIRVGLTDKCESRPQRVGSDFCQAWRLYGFEYRRPTKSGCTCNLIYYMLTDMRLVIVRVTTPHLRSSCDEEAP